MTALIVASTYLFFGVVLPIASLELLLWLAPKTPAYKRRLRRR